MAKIALSTLLFTVVALASMYIAAYIAFSFTYVLVRPGAERFLLWLQKAASSEYLFGIVFLTIVLSVLTTITFCLLLKATTFRKIHRCAWLGFLVSNIYILSTIFIHSFL